MATKDLMNKAVLNKIWKWPTVLSIRNFLSVAIKCKIYFKKGIFIRRIESIIFIKICFILPRKEIPVI